MAISLSEISQSRKQAGALKYLVFAALAIIAAVFAWKFIVPLFKGNSEQSVVVGSLAPKIDFSILESEKTKSLELFEPIKNFDGEFGRSDPFSPLSE